jgi:hypothetical protein
MFLLSTIHPSLQEAWQTAGLLLLYPKPPFPFNQGVQSKQKQIHRKQNHPKIKACSETKAANRKWGQLFRPKSREAFPEQARHPSRHTYECIGVQFTYEPKKGGNIKPI